MRRIATPLALALAVALAAAGTAAAGGVATVGLDSLPAGLAPGEPWRLEITVLQHGNAATPVTDAKPRLEIVDAAGETTVHEAAPTATPGVYAVTATFPEAGTYTYRVYDGFEAALPRWHTFAPVTIAGPAARGFPVFEAALAAALGLAAVAGGALFVRRGRERAAGALRVG